MEICLLLWKMFEFETKVIENCALALSLTICAICGKSLSLHNGFIIYAIWIILSIMYGFCK